MECHRSKGGSSKSMAAKEVTKTQAGWENASKALVKEESVNGTIPIKKRIEEISGEKIIDNIIYQKSFYVKDFMGDYNSYKGNAYGLANTLFQTSIFKPKMKSKKVKGLYFTGQLTVPGPGVPPSLISGKIVSSEVIKDYPNQ